MANDLTDASLNPVTRFKSQFGGELTPTWSVARTDSWRFRLNGAARQIKSGLQKRWYRTSVEDAA